MVSPFAWNCWNSQATRSVGERASENVVGLEAATGIGTGAIVVKESIFVCTLPDLYKLAPEVHISNYGNQ